MEIFIAFEYNYQTIYLIHLLRFTFIQPSVQIKSIVTALNRMICFIEI